MEGVDPDHVCYTASARPLRSHAVHALAALAGTDRRMCLAQAGATVPASNMLMLLSTPTMQNMQMGGQMVVSLGHIFIC